MLVNARPVGAAIGHLILIHNDGKQIWIHDRQAAQPRAVFDPENPPFAAQTTHGLVLTRRDGASTLESRQQQLEHNPHADPDMTRGRALRPVDAGALPPGGDEPHRASATEATQPTAPTDSAETGETRSAATSSQPDGPASPPGNEPVESRRETAADRIRMLRQRNIELILTYAQLAREGITFRAHIVNQAHDQIRDEISRLGSTGTISDDVPVVAGPDTQLAIDWVFPHRMVPRATEMAHSYLAGRGNRAPAEARDQLNELWRMITRAAAVSSGTGYARDVAKLEAVITIAGWTDQLGDGGNRHLFGSIRPILTRSTPSPHSIYPPHADSTDHVWAAGPDSPEFRTAQSHSSMRVTARHHGRSYTPAPTRTAQRIRIMFDRNKIRPNAADTSSTTTRCCPRTSCALCPSLPKPPTWARSRNSTQRGCRMAGPCISVRSGTPRATPSWCLPALRSGSTVHCRTHKRWPTADTLLSSWSDQGTATPTPARAHGGRLRPRHHLHRDSAVRLRALLGTRTLRRRLGGDRRLCARPRPRGPRRRARRHVTGPRRSWSLDEGHGRAKPGGLPERICGPSGTWPGKPRRREPG